MWGTPQVDLFASETAHVVMRYVSLDTQDQQALFHNAFLHQWDYELAWLFPPPNLIPQVLSHLNTANGQYILIAPKWKMVFWQADLQARAIQEPYHIPLLPQVLIDTKTGMQPARDTRHSFGSLADFGWTDEIKEWSVEERSLLLSSWRRSTINTYMPAWNKWKVWCSSNNSSYRDPSPEQVARYLAYLHNSEGLAYRTILVHKSVISTFTKLSGNTTLASNFLIKHILKAISVAKDKKMKPPIWNVKNVLQYLENNTPDENNLYQVSRRAAILLLLAAGRRVHDLTLLRINADQYIDKGNSIVMWPCFGSKTDDANNRQSGWKLKAHPNKNLDCVFWTRQLIGTSQDRRKSGMLSELFITARGDPKPASRTVISGWIKSVLKDAGVDATPGSVRSAVASLNWLEKFPIDQILQTGNWRQEHTFRTYYQRELANQSRNNDFTTSVSLSNFFEPV